MKYLYAYTATSGLVITSKQLCLPHFMATAKSEGMLDRPPGSPDAVRLIAVRGEPTHYFRRVNARMVGNALDRRPRDPVHDATVSKVGGIANKAKAILVSTYLRNHPCSTRFDGPLIAECSSRFAVYIDGPETRIRRGGHYAQVDLILQDISEVEGYRRFCLAIEVIHKHPPEPQTLEILRRKSQEDGCVIGFFFALPKQKWHRLSQAGLVGSVLRLRLCRYIKNGEYYRNGKPFLPAGRSLDERYQDLRARFFRH